MLTVIAWVSVGLAIASFVLAFVQRNQAVEGSMQYRSQKREVHGAGFGIFFAAAVVFLLLAMSIAFYQANNGEGSTTAGPSANATSSSDRSSSSMSTSLPDSSPPPPSGSGPTAVSALAFVRSFLDSVNSGRHAPSDLSHWFVLPAQFYGDKDVRNLDVISRAYAPKPKNQQTHFEQPRFVSFDIYGKQYILNVSVDYTRPSGKSGTTYVTYILEASTEGKPYRIRSVTEN